MLERLIFLRLLILLDRRNRRLFWISWRPGVSESPMRGRRASRGLGVVVENHDDGTCGSWKG